MGTLTVHRTPGSEHPQAMPQGEIRLQSPPELPEQASDGFAQALMYLPMGAMAIGMIAVVAGGHASAILYVGSGAMAVGMVGMMAGQVMRGRGDRKIKLNGLRRDYLRYLSQVRDRARRAAAAQREFLDYYGPDPASLPSRVLAGQLWQRAPADSGFLNVRCATGTQALALALIPPDTKPLEDLDPLCAGALRRFVRSFSSVPGLPVSVRLRSFTRVCADGDADAARDLIRALVAQVAVAHSPADVRISVCASRDRMGEWEWIKWLPHNMHPAETDAAGPVRLLAPTMGALAALLEPELRDRPRFASSAGTGALPFQLIIADGVAADPAAELAGVDGVLIIDMTGNLTLSDPAPLRLRVTREQLYDGDTAQGIPDALSLVAAEALARQLAPLRPAPAEPATDALAVSATLASLLGVPDPHALNLAELWRPRAPRDQLRVPLGYDATGTPVELDIKESAQDGMGPHGLIIGATGSGKSELLRTIVLGLAMTHSPEQLNFVLVDFKGGATFLGLERLPHVSAVITNLADELPLVDRMRDALAGELVRRQELFRQGGNYASLRDYTAARAAGAALAPIPTLFVVLDEFSELLAAKPEFVDLFVTIGRLGRSLGVHLLLASQRLEEGRLRGLETQLSYRIGLRTFSAQESRIVLGVPDAYELPAQPGNGFLKVDTSGMARFKAAYVSGPATKGEHITTQDGPRTQPVVALFGPRYLPPQPTEAATGDAGPAARPPTAVAAHSLLDVVVAQLAPLGPTAHEIWLPPLDQSPTLAELLPPLAITPRGLGPADAAAQHALRAVLGIVDRPYDQRRDPLWVDLSAAGGHVAVVGAPRSGKSTVLRTLVSSLALLHTPAEVQFYILDFGGGTLSALGGLPHVGGVAARADSDQVRRTIADLVALLEQRERSFAKQGIGSIAAYRELAGADDGFGDVFLVVDSWLTLRQDYEDLEPIVTALAARGLGYGIHVVAASSKWSEFRLGIRDLFGTRLELRLGDPYESEVGRAAAANVPADSPGRGLTPEGLHFLAALPRLDPVAAHPVAAHPSTADGAANGSAAARPDSPDATRALADAVAQAWGGARAPAVRMLPGELPTAALPPASGSVVPFGIDENALAPVSVDFAADPHFMVFGDTECGKSNLLRVLSAGIASAYTDEQAKIIFIDYRRSLLDFSELPHQIGYATSSVTASSVLNEARTALLKRLPSADAPPSQLRAKTWSGPELFVIVDNYELVATSVNPLLPLSELLPQAQDIGLHVVLARASGGAGRAMFEPVIQRIREMGSPGLVMSGSKDEGPLLGGLRATALPVGRGYLIDRRAGTRLVQTARHS
ncbi:MAG TPA: type VII secretion protein EccCa [Trebonia sp.]|nr:type VII secretion protein EccCa [Trebonia sp.]